MHENFAGQVVRAFKGFPDVAEKPYRDKWEIKEIRRRKNLHWIVRGVLLQLKIYERSLKKIEGQRVKTKFDESIMKGWKTFLFLRVPVHYCKLLNMFEKLWPERYRSLFRAEIVRTILWSDYDVTILRKDTLSIRMGNITQPLNCTKGSSSMKSYLSGSTVYIRFTRTHCTETTKESMKLNFCRKEKRLDQFWTKKHQIIFVRYMNLYCCHEVSTKLCLNNSGN